jgi:hypothetical protein
MFNYGYGRSLSSVPRHLTAPNGLNFSRSIHNPKSRLNRVRDYLSFKGEATKMEILRDVFGKTLGKGGWKNREVTSGWGCYLFSYGVHQGFFKKVRRGNQVFWSNT